MDREDRVAAAQVLTWLCAALDAAQCALEATDASSARAYRREGNRHLQESARLLQQIAARSTLDDDGRCGPPGTAQRPSSLSQGGFMAVNDQYGPGSAFGALSGQQDPRGGTAPGSAGIAPTEHSGPAAGTVDLHQDYVSGLQSLGTVTVGDHDTTSTSDGIGAHSSAIAGNADQASFNSPGPWSGHVGGPPHPNSANGRGPEV